MFDWFNKWDKKQFIFFQFEWAKNENEYDIEAAVKSEVVIFWKSSRYLKKKKPLHDKICYQEIALSSDKSSSWLIQWLNTTLFYQRIFAVLIAKNKIQLDVTLKFVCFYTRKIKWLAYVIAE